MLSSVSSLPVAVTQSASAKSDILQLGVAAAPFGDFQARAEFRVRVVNGMRKQSRQKRTAAGAFQKLCRARQQSENQAHHGWIGNIACANVDLKFRPAPEAARSARAGRRRACRAVAWRRRAGGGIRGVSEFLGNQCAKIFARQLPEKIVQAALQRDPRKPGLLLPVPGRISEMGIQVPANVRPAWPAQSPCFEATGLPDTVRDCASTSGTPRKSSAATAWLPAANRPENNWAGSYSVHAVIREHPRASGKHSPADQIETIASANGQILRLNGSHRKYVRQVKNANQTRFTIASLESCLRRNDLHSRPGGK